MTPARSLLPAAAIGAILGVATVIFALAYWSEYAPRHIDDTAYTVTIS